MKKICTDIWDLEKIAKLLESEYKDAYGEPVEAEIYPGGQPLIIMSYVEEVEDKEA